MRCAGLGEPFRLEVLGACSSSRTSDKRVGVPANIARGALPSARRCRDELPPIVVLVGTSMDAGKTTAAAADRAGSCAAASRSPPAR